MSEIIQTILVIVMAMFMVGIIGLIVGAHCAEHDIMAKLVRGKPVTLRASVSRDYIVTITESPKVEDEE